MDLRDVPFHAGVRLFIDGSSRVIEGKRYNGYAVVDGTNSSVMEAGRLPNGWSAQTCELYALERALRALENKEGTVYTDSKYAFGVVHTFGKIWQERGLINSRGKELVHEELIKRVLESLLLPGEIAVVHVNGHQKGNELEVRGNRLADEVAKEAALNPQEVVIHSLIPTVPGPREAPIFTESEENELRDLGAVKTADGHWRLPDGREMLNKMMMREIMAVLHQGSHWGVQAMCDLVLREYGCKGIYTIAKQICEGCIICKKVNKKVLRKQTPGGRDPGLRPFQSIQVDIGAHNSPIWAREPY
ncbi:uncharacterized protein [Chiloscyllium punctatum]|uniref:uncharacterized protein n=1 Tax=Chiloscyllium punctatum TaxID=137246 RepID=UPI003B641C5F